jgi:hypothetical protein
MGAIDRIEPKSKGGCTTLIALVVALGFLALLYSCGSHLVQTKNECSGQSRRTTATITVRDGKFWDACTGKALPCYRKNDEGEVWDMCVNRRIL